MSRFLDELRALIAHPDVNDVRVYAFEDSVVLDSRYPDELMAGAVRTLHDKWVRA